MMRSKRLGNDIQCGILYTRIKIVYRLNISSNRTAQEEQIIANNRFLRFPSDESIAKIDDQLDYGLDAPPSYEEVTKETDEIGA